MSKKVATAKQTGGGGFSFEDKVAAWFLIDLLREAPLIEGKGIIQKIEFQVRPDGWLLDDLLLTLKSDNDSNFPISVKSNVQFTANGPNNDLLNDLWSQFTNDEFEVFNPENDFLGIINSTMSAGLSNDLNVLLKAAKKGDIDKLTQRLEKGKDGSFSESQIKLFNAFNCPQEIAKRNKVNKSDTWHLLSKIILIEFDFEKDTSQYKSLLIDKCKSCLRNSNGIEEIQLFEKLCQIRRDLAPVEGAYLTYHKLVEILNTQFDLIGHPNHLNDWTKIKSTSNSDIDKVQDKIGGKLSLDRGTEVDEIWKLVQESKVTFVLGESGYGKSVLAKSLVKTKITDAKYIWLNAESFDENEVDNYFKVTHSVSGLIDRAQDSMSYLIIDGIDRFFNETQLRKIHSLLSSAINRSKNWKIIATCQTSDYERVLRNLYRLNLSFTTAIFELKPFIHDHYSAIGEKFEGLRNILIHDHIGDILNNLKYLDLLAYNESQYESLELTDSFGECNMIEWIWKEEIVNKRNENGEQRSMFLQELGNHQAENSVIGVATSQFSIPALEPLNSLKEDKIIKEDDGRLFYHHDLFGDWSRYKLIQGNRERFKEFILSKNLLSPLWMKAIRLFGLYLLEKDNSIEKYVGVLKSFDSSNPQEKIIQDVLLESVIYSSSPSIQLELLWELFSADEGLFLTRFLDRFLISATRPNSAILKIASEIGGYSEAQASSVHRVPIPIYWFPVLRYLHNHVDQVSELSRRKLAVITQIWLDRTAEGYPFRKEAAFCAFKNAEIMFQFKIHDHAWVKGDVDQVIFRAMLSGVKEYPEEVVDLSLKLSRRKAFERPEKKPLDPELEPAALPARLLASIRDETQWEHGPSERVDDAFEEVCLHTDALHELIKHESIIAKEILLALLIDPPSSITSYDSMHYKLDVNSPHKWHYPIYSNGPFLYFLKVNPKVAISCILDFINFATNQWTNQFVAKEIEVPSFVIPFESGDKRVIGNDRVYFWFRNVGSIPGSIPSLLMALEKFLMSQIDEGKPINEYLRQIIDSNTSAAIIGLLCSLGKHKNQLFLNELKPLLNVFQIYSWEKQLDYGHNNIEGHQLILFHTNSEKLRNEHRDWHHLPHRKKSVGAIVLPILLVNDELNNYFENIRAKWAKELENESDATDPEFVFKTNMISQFNRKNYRTEDMEGNILLTYIEPQETTEKLKDIREASKELDDFFTPMQYRKDIEENVQYSQEQIESLWITTKGRMEKSQELDFSQLSLELKCIFGGFAVLIKNMHVWKESNPEYLNEILDYSEMIFNRCPSGTSELYMSEISDSWKAFSALYLPIIWAEDFSNKRVRKLIATFLLKSSYDITEKFCESTAEHLDWFNSNFIQLQNLIIQWSLLLYDFFQQPREEREQIKMTKFKSLLVWLRIAKLPIPEVELKTERIIGDFIQGKTATSLMNWSKTRLVEPKWSNYSWKQEESTNCRQPGLLTEFIEHAFSSMPSDLNQYQDEQRVLVLEFWEKIVEQIVFELGIIDDKSTVYGDYPKEFHGWALENLGTITLQLEEKDRPERFWKPILRYGKFAPHFNEYLIRSIVSKSLREKKGYESLKRHWSVMVNYTEEHANWQEKKFFSSDGEYHLLLYGLSYYQSDYWGEEQSDFFEFASQKIIDWIKKNISNQEILRRLLVVIQKRVGSIILKDGIQLIGEHIESQIASGKIDPPKGYVKREFKYSEELAICVGNLWDNYSDIIKEDRQTFNSFKKIVLYLVSIQNSIGVELQNRI